MELFGIVLAIPAAFVGSAVYSLALRFVLRRWAISGPTLWCSVAVLSGLAVEWIALAMYGPLHLQQVTRGFFFPLHVVVFVLSVPALASVLVVKRGESWLGSWITIGIACAVLALPVVLTQYGVSEALYGIG